MYQFRNWEGLSKGSIILAACALAAVVVLVSAIKGSVSQSDKAALGDPVIRQEASVHSSPASSPGKSFAVTVRRPTGPPRVATGVTDLHGNEVTVSCATCHTTRDANFHNKAAADLDEFHGSLVVEHGNISCLSCHHSDDYDALRLADGSRVEFVDVMTLCGQCHGSQMKDYEHGTHGGMTGYWDLSRGPQVKNNCIDCHHPHSPRFPKMQPTFKPRDRFLSAPSHRESHGTQETDSQPNGHSP